MFTAIFALAESDQHAASIIRRLNAAGFDDNDVSLLVSDQVGGRDLKHVNSTKAPEGAVGGAVGGGVVGGLFGFVAGAGALAIPGLGALVAAGPILAALSGAATAGTLGGLAGALMGMGAPEFEATQYEGQVRGGKVLISVHTRSDKEADRVVEILEAEQATSVSRAREEVVPSE